MALSKTAVTLHNQRRCLKSNEVLLCKFDNSAAEVFLKQQWRKEFIVTNRSDLKSGCNCLSNNQVKSRIKQ